MDIESGWLKWHRQGIYNPIVCKDTIHLALWVTMLSLASHSEYKVIFNNQEVVLKPGQFITGRKKLSTFFVKNIEETKVERVLKAFEKQQMIEQQTCSKNRLITIVNWAKYQQDEQQTAQQVHSNCTTTAQQVHTNKNVKNDKNVRNKEKIYKKENPSFLKFWACYPKKKSKTSALKAFEKINPDDELLCAMLSAVEIQKKSSDWVKDNGQYIPYPATWLNGSRWEDEQEINKRDYNDDDILPY